MNFRDIKRVGSKWIDYEHLPYGKVLLSWCITRILFSLCTGVSVHGSFLGLRLGEKVSQLLFHD